ncbi:hypothetical protein AMECASPLE_009547 [Ameca splendens]|uniref:Uncharacterized protein n=1 Tax=Ameca splendens TaxID=208324 RepID=A0ABV0ZJZ0_9TELE
MVSGLSHDSMFGCLLCLEMCQVWSCFGLLLLYFFFTCTLVFLLYVLLVCLCVLLELLFETFYFCNAEFPHKYHKSAKKKIKKETCSLTSPFPPSDPQSICVTHTHSQQTKTAPTAPHPTAPSLPCIQCVASLSD